MTELSGIAEEKKVNEITKEERMRFVRLIKDFKMTLTSLRSYSEAIITKGGVSVKEIHPGTMESKFVKNFIFLREKFWILMLLQEVIIFRLHGLRHILRE